MTHDIRRWLNAVRTLCEAKPPEPTSRDLLDAIDHADHWQLGWQLSDFELRYLGYLSVDEIGEYDDLGSWPDVETPDDLQSFRGGKFVNAPHLIASPIIIITAPDEGECHTQVGDGRGRVNYAIAHGIRLHTWHLIHKECAE